MRSVAMGRTNYLFGGLLTGDRTAAYILIETAKLYSVDPQARLAKTLAGIRDYKVACVDDHLPWNSPK